MDLQKWVYFAIGFAAVFIGAAYHNAASVRRSGSPLTDFQGFLFGTGFAYASMAVWTLLSFILDYYIPGMDIQGYTRVPRGNELFYRLFGPSLAGAAQYPVLNLDFNLLSCMLGCALGGAALLVWRAVREKKTPGADTGLLYGYRFQPVGFKAYFAREWKTFRSQVYWPEYVLWWALRIAMAVALARKYKENGFDTVSLQLTVNLIATFIIPLIRLLFFSKLFFGNVNYRVQTLIDVFVFSGSLLGQGMGLVGKVEEFDKLLHLVSGGVAVFIGSLLIENMRSGRAISKFSKTAAAVGFSCTVMMVWEFFEFCTDWFMPNSSNQNYYYNPADNNLFFKILGRGARNPGQFAVLDTDFDLLAAAAGCAVCAGVLYAMLTVYERRQQREKAPAPCETA